MMEFFKARRNFYIVLIVAIFFAGGFYIGYYQNVKIHKEVALENMQSSLPKTDFSPFWKVWSLLDEKYPNASEVTDQERVYGAISGLVGSLNDPYSTFFNPEDTKLFEEDIAGNFSGVGMEVGMKDKILTVIAPLKDTPAYKAGIKPGDKILKIDEQETSELSVERAVKLIRGEKGTEVKLTIFRDGETEPREIKIVRDVINVPTLDTETKGDVFIIRLYSFSANSPDLFRKAVKEFAESGKDKLLLDLRGNPGGYLDAAVSMSSWFLPSGKTVVTEEYANGEKPTVYRSEGYNVFNENLKFVILTDAGSASASEILAGAMQDYKRAILVGEQSYGKGSVQEVVEVTDDTILKITVAKWLTPNGNTIAEVGLTPDYEVEVTKEDIEKKVDAQEEKGIEILNNWSTYAKAPAR